MHAAVESPPAASRSLVLGSANRKKAIELHDLLVPLGLRLETLADYPQALAVDETGTTFAENAQLKATQQARHLNRWVLGDDSGLVVDALSGAPGVYSARFAGPQATDEDNRQKLLTEMSGVAVPRRAAHFVCYLVLADPSGTVRATSEGRCHGCIRVEPSGTGGFGYDPLFEVVEYHRTFGELSAAVKGCLSHRARAIYHLLPQLQALIAAGEWSGGG